MIYSIYSIYTPFFFLSQLFPLRTYVAYKLVICLIIRTKCMLFKFNERNLGARGRGREIEFDIVGFVPKEKKKTTLF